jgi:hypothetical protein
MCLEVSYSSSFFLSERLNTMGSTSCMYTMYGFLASQNGVLSQLTHYKCSYIST